MSKITLNTGNIEKIKADALSPKVEADLVKLLQARAAIEALIEQVEDAIGKSMEKNDVKLIEHGRIKITRSVTGRKYSLDPKEPIDAVFLKPVTYNNVNSAAVEEYYEKNKTLPVGVVEKGRAIRVKIELEE